MIEEASMATTTFWCSWCGATAQAESPDVRRICRRCGMEFWNLFGYPPRTEMYPLAPGEKPPQPAGAKRQFVFVDPLNGNELARTEPILLRPKAAKRERSARRRRAS